MPFSHVTCGTRDVMSKKVDYEDKERDVEMNMSSPVMAASEEDPKMLTPPDIQRDTSGLTAQYIAAGIATLGALASGASLSWSATAVPLLVSRNSTHAPAYTPYEASWAAALLGLGACVGAIPAGLISEYFGRKKTLLMLALPMFVSWMLIASSPNIWGLYVGRFVGGLATGALSVATPPYVADVAEPSTRAHLVTYHHLQTAAGVLFGYIVGMVQNVTLLSVLCATLPVTYFIAFLFMPESPVYLMSQGKTVEAKAALHYFRGIHNDIEDELTSIKENMRNLFKNRATFKDLVNTRSTVKALVVSFGLMVFQQLSGVFAIIFNSTKIFQQCVVYMSPPLASILLGVIFVIATYTSTILLGKFRRRLLLIVSFVVMAISLSVLGVYFHVQHAYKEKSNTWIPVLSLCVFISMYAIGAGPIPWLMLRQIFPANLTRRATAFAAAFSWFLTFGITKLYQNMVDSIGTGWVMFNFGIICMIGAVFVYFVVPETKDKDLNEIQNELNGVPRRRRHRHIIEVESGSENEY